jgi:cellulose synthase/poly-beta-1,6-N-acetylglucosamine synthase-like glycosyltransferase
MHHGSHASGGSWSVPYSAGGGGDGPLPPEIAFLASHGVTIPELISAARYAASWGVSPSEALLALGSIDEDDFYRALAAETGVALLPSDVEISPRVRYEESIRAGVAPLRPNHRRLTFAVAPRGGAVREFLLRGPRLAEFGVALASPRRLSERVVVATRAAVARRAAHGLADADPALSARDGASLAQLMTTAAFIGAVSFAATLAPALARGVLTGLIGLVFLAMVVVRLACATQAIPVKPRRSVRRAADEHLPIYTIIVPLFRETRIVEQLLTALMALDYPRAKLDIKLVLEEDDRPMRAAVRALALPSFVEVIVAPRGEPRTKPRALNVALPLARGDFIVVYDAEDIPDPQQLRLAVATFARMPRSIACLQARLVIDNAGDGLLPTLFAIEYMGLFDVINPGLASYGLPVPLGGTSNHFRTRVLREVGGWDAWNVTEDADLGIRLACMGYGVADLPSATREEAPVALDAWVRQRSRWMKGWMQVCVTHSRRPIATIQALGGFGFLGVLTMAYGTVASALCYPIFIGIAIAATIEAVASGVGSLETHSVPSAGLAALALTVFVAGAFSMIVPALVGILRRGPRRLLLYLPLLPLYYILVSMASWRGLGGLILTPFSWNKTEHGLARRREALSFKENAADPGRPRPAGA